MGKAVLWLWKVWYLLKRRVCILLRRWGCVDQCNLELCYIDWYLEVEGFRRGGAPGE